MGILSRFNKPKSGVFHSSGIAAAAHQNPGSVRARPTSAWQTYKTETARQHIGTYRQSTIARDFSQRAQLPSRDEEATFNRPADSVKPRGGRFGSIDIVKSSGGRQQMNAQVINQPCTVRPNFSQPISRKYNPYG